MDNYTWLIAELLMAQHAHELMSPSRRVDPEAPGRHGARRALGSAFVRLGLRLDPGAAERAGALTLSSDGRHAR